MTALKKAFYERETVDLARQLIGTCLVYKSSEGIAMGRIVETEAYLSVDDPASHAYRGETPRNSAMFGPCGHCYIYLIYGMHYCFNVVSGPKGVGQAVLIRALEPIAGIPLMERRRGTTVLKNLCNGPGKLVQALGLTRAQNACSLMRGPLTIHSGGSFGIRDDFEIAVSKRIGITKAAHLPLRFSIKDNPFVSR